MRVENQEQENSLENRTENEKASVIVATGASEKRISLGVIPVEVKAKGSEEVRDSGSQITLCKEELRESLGMERSRSCFELTGVTESATVEGGWWT